MNQLIYGQCFVDGYSHFHAQKHRSNRMKHLLLMLIHIKGKKRRTTKIQAIECIFGIMITIIPHRE